MPEINCIHCEENQEVSEADLNNGSDELTCTACGERFALLPGGQAYVKSASGSSAGGAGATGSASATGTPGGGVEGFNLTMAGGASQGSAGSDGLQSTPAPSVLDRIPFSPGDRVGDYEMRALLGAGAFGAVYAAYNWTTEREVAVKVVLPGDGEGDDEALRQLREENRHREQIFDIRHIVVSHSLTRQKYDDISLITMEMPLAKMSFRQWLENKPAKEDEEEWLHSAIGLLVEACQGVDAMHQAGLTHLDLKPENILLFENEEGSEEAQYTAKITDFGLARVQSQVQGQQGIGTPPYMAPEQFSGRPKDMTSPTDVYALGIMFFEILDGEPPFRGRSFEEYHNAHQNNPVPHASWWDRWGELFGAFRKILVRALEKDPAERQQNAREFWISVKKAFEGGDRVINVNCPDCGYTNRNPVLQFCENCDSNISEFFRSCPRCSADVRRDQEECQECGYDVGSYFLQQDRWAKVGQLKHSEPKEARRILMLLLKENSGKFEGEAKEKLRDLRSKLKDASKLIKDAREFGETGNLYPARESWEALLKLFAKHKEGLQRKSELEKQISKLEIIRDEVLENQSKAKFDAAKSCIRKGLSEFPGSGVFQDLKAKLEDVEQIYAENVEGLEDAQSNHAFIPFVSHLETLQGVTPLSTRVIEAQETLKDVRRQTSEAQEAFENCLKAAEFDSADAKLSTIRELQNDLESLPGLQGRLQNVSTDFIQLSQKADSEKRDKRWDLVVSTAGEMFALCPDARMASEIKSYGTEQIEHARMLQRELETCLENAEFEKAEDKLSEFQAHYPKGADFDSLTNRIKEMRERYNSLLSKADQDVSAKRLSSAVDGYRKILDEVAIDASEVRERLNSVEEAIVQARRELESAVFEANEGRFAAAKRHFSQSVGLPDEERSRTSEHIHALMQAARVEKLDRTMKTLSRIAYAVSFGIGIAIGFFVGRG